jgi:3-oxoacyl-[acyl-carrier-protein] synthase-3
MAFLRSFGSYLPSRVVPNSEVAAIAGCEPAWIVQVSGIEERRYAAADETVVEMGVRAGKVCLERSEGVQPGAVIVSSGTGARRFPGPAAEIAQQLGLGGVFALDIPVASAGSLIGIALANELCEAHGPVLVIASERMSEVVMRPPVEKNTAVLFGDGAGAVLVDPAEGVARVEGSILRTDGSFAAELQLTAEGQFRMNGMSVIMQASRKLPRVMEELSEKAGVAIADVHTFVLHQANQNLLHKIADMLKAPRERFYSQISRYGNTSSASLLIALAEWAAGDGLRPGEPAMLAAFGAGFQWGAMLIRGV